MSSMLSSRGTNDPVDPRTWRIIGPRFTVSGQMVERSTVGAAGFSRATPRTPTVNTTTATPVHTAYWRIFLRFKSGRAISIDWRGSICRSKGLRAMRIEKKYVSLNRTRAGAPEVAVSGAALFDFGQCGSSPRAGWEPIRIPFQNHDYARRAHLRRNARSPT